MVRRQYGWRRGRWAAWKEGRAAAAEWAAESAAVAWAAVRVAQKRMVGKTDVATGGGESGGG